MASTVLAHVDNTGMDQGPDRPRRRSFTDGIGGSSASDPTASSEQCRFVPPAFQSPEIPPQAILDAEQARLRCELAQSSYASHYKGRVLRPGQPFARLIVPDHGVNLIVQEGTTLRAGAGHYADSSYPGERGNVVILGQGGEGYAFGFIDRMAAGQLAVIESAEGDFAYRVLFPSPGRSNPRRTSSSDISALVPTDEPILTLIASQFPPGDMDQVVLRLGLVGSNGSIRTRALEHGVGLRSAPFTLRQVRWICPQVSVFEPPPRAHGSCAR